MKTVYVAGAFDLFSADDIESLRICGGDDIRLIVGVRSDEDCRLLGFSPLLSYDDRVFCVGMGGVADVVVTAPLFVSLNFYRFHGITDHLVDSVEVLPDGALPSADVSGINFGEYIHTDQSRICYMKLLDLGWDSGNFSIYRIRENQANVSWCLQLESGSEEKAYLLKLLVASELEHFLLKTRGSFALNSSFVMYPYIFGTCPYTPSMDELVVLFNSYEIIDVLSIAGYDLAVREMLVKLDDGENSEFMVKNRDAISEIFSCSHWSLCHCDLDKYNIILGHDRALHLIDWEFSMYAPIECDIACLLCRGLLSLLDIDIFIKRLECFSDLSDEDLSVKVKLVVLLGVLFSYGGYMWIRDHPRPGELTVRGANIESFHGCYLDLRRTYELWDFLRAFKLE